MDRDLVHRSETCAKHGVSSDDWIVFTTEGISVWTHEANAISTFSNVNDGEERPIVKGICVSIMKPQANCCMDMQAPCLGRSWPWVRGSSRRDSAMRGGAYVAILKS